MMNDPSKRYSLIAAFVFYGQVIQASDSGVQALANAIGATDYFKVSCSSNDTETTDHFSLKLLDNTYLASADNPLNAPQIINVRVDKDGGTDYISALSATQGKELNIAKGNGKYIIQVDTTGTNTAVTKPQAYSVQYRCLNSDGVDTKSTAPGLISAKNVNKTIKNNKIAKFTVNCMVNKKQMPADTSSLYLKIVNISNPVVDSVVAAMPTLSAQVTRIDSGNTLNTTDLTGDLIYSNEINLKGGNNKSISGNGDYFVAVNSTASNESADNHKNYSFQYSCLSATNNPTVTGELMVIQDQ